MPLRTALLNHDLSFSPLTGSPKPSPKSSLAANLIQMAKRQSNTFPLFSEGLMRTRTAQEKAVALEQQVLMLTKELKSQKVSSGPGRPQAPLTHHHPTPSQMFC